MMVVQLAEGGHHLSTLAHSRNLTNISLESIKKSALMLEDTHDVVALVQGFQEGKLVTGLRSE